MRTLKIIIPAIIVLSVIGCDGTSPNKPGNTDRPLAGGGRFSDNDPFTGGLEDSGPTTDDSLVNWPPGEPILPEFDFLFGWDRDCTESPGTRVIQSSEDWAAWWKAHNACIWRDCWEDSSGVHNPADSLYPDSTKYTNCESDPPPVDFEHESVIAIAVEYDSGSFCWRSVWINDVEYTSGGATISYEVSQLDSTCCMLLMMPMLLTGYSPVIAVRVPETIGPEISWIRNDGTHNCVWEPDPDEPLALYYTDSDCNLGDGEQLITDADRWNEWYHQAWSCDSARWSGYVDDPTYPPGDSSGITEPGDDTIPKDPGVDPGWRYWTPEVDFSTHAVIILRAGAQTRWGGGIWLSALENTVSGTEISYTVMEPAENCPAIDPLVIVNPTVAVRLRLPLDPPINWQRSVETISCDWGADSSWVKPWPGRDSL